MQWSDFYSDFWDWADSTRGTKISSLENIGSGEEVVEVLLEIQDEKVRARLLRKAMKLGVIFTSEDFENLDGELAVELYEQLGQYTGFDPNDPSFDENNMTWDDFCDRYWDWDEAVLLQRIKKLAHFGSPDAVLETIMDMPSDELGLMLYQKAVEAGVQFTKEQRMDLGEWHPALESAEAETAGTGNRHTGFFGALFAALFGMSGEPKPMDNGRCNGDCSNCPAHYGYRYGRWYYGHGHQHGCDRGGNGGATGRTDRD